MSNFNAINVALTGLFASQRALEVTAQNVANANTEGYSRQRVVYAANQPVPGTIYGTHGRPGAGVSVIEYQRLRDELLDRQMHEQLAAHGDAEARLSYLELLEANFPEPSDTGLRSRLDAFWASLQDLANQPISSAARQAVVDAATILATAFRDTYQALDHVSSIATVELQQRLAEVNSIAVQIQDLTRAIRNNIITENSPNELMDRRDALLDQLAAIGNVTVTKYDDGNIDVVFGGFALISSGTAVTVTEAGLTALTSGKIYGLQQVRDVLVPDYQDKLNQLAQGLISVFNARHAAGFDLDGNPGGAFFAGSDASDIDVEAAIKADPRLVAASKDGTPGNGENALELAEVRDLAGTVAGQSVIGFYQSMITNLGATTIEQRNRYQIQEVLVANLQSRRDIVSGVSLDEEMANMLNYQRAYQANARMLTALDEIIELIVSRLGKVGL